MRPFAHPSASRLRVPLRTELADLQLPSGWELARIGEKFAFTGKPKGLRFEDSQAIPFVPMERIPSDRLYFSDFGLKTPQEISSGTYFEEGDLLVSKITPCFENGKQGIAIGIPGGFGIATTEVVPIKSVRGVSYLPFLAMYMLHPDVRNRLAGRMEGATGRQRLPKSVLEEWVMPFPPLHEQKAIAGVPAKIQAAVEVQEKIVARLRELKAATMAKLFHEGVVRGFMFDSHIFDKIVDGRLDPSESGLGKRLFITHVQRDEIERTPDLERRDRLVKVFEIVPQELIATESAVWNVSRWGQAKWGHSPILEELSKGNMKHTEDALIAETCIKQRLVLVTEEKDLRNRVRRAGGEAISFENFLARRWPRLRQTEIGEIPESWEVVRLEEVARIERGKFAHRPRNDPRFYGGSIPFIQTGDVAKSNGWIRTYTQTLNEEGLAISRLFPKGTIVLTIAANIADTAILEFDSAFPDSLVGITPAQTIDAVFLLYYLQTQKAEMDRLAPKGTQKNINIQFLRPWPVPRPSLDEQREIAHSLRRLDERLETALAKSATLKTTFFSMLHLLMTGRVRVTRRMIALQALADREARRLKWSGKVDEKVLEEIVRRIIEAVAPERIILFGSAARGEMGPDSDLDLLVVKPCDRPREEARIIRRNLIGIRMPIDLLVVTPEHLEKHKDTIGYIYRPALREGKVIYAA